MPLKKRFQQLKSRWQTSTPRDQFILALGAVLLISLALYWLLIAPWMSLQNKLDNALPRLRSDFANMQQMAKQQALLRSNHKTGGDSQQLQTDLLGQFTPPNAALRNDGTERLHLTINQGDFDNILARLAGLQQKHPMRIISAKFTRLTNSTQVQAEIILALPKPQ
ncbi:MAG: type II secretion system protein GspM [Rhodocyclaceae bacterium]|nr:type II secretion system protein GspM [Rhodocyclaceae bacterium]